MKRFNEIKNWSIGKVTFADIQDYIPGDLFAPIFLPVDFMTTELINSERRFLLWKKEFISEYGDEGLLCVGKYTCGATWDAFKIRENKKWDASCKSGCDSINEFYRHSKIQD